MKNGGARSSLPVRRGQERAPVSTDPPLEEDQRWEPPDVWQLVGGWGPSPTPESGARESQVRLAPGGGLEEPPRGSGKCKTGATLGLGAGRSMAVNHRAVQERLNMIGTTFAQRRMAQSLMGRAKGVKDKGGHTCKKGKIHQGHVIQATSRQKGGG
ncbi:hypothetical protein NDU88_005983 [Pleurodeles waltl]|uniref:Uncharacterized protein n=1 Tax=Pleurodeles waltl TaxID=8319 RepID=A0AAV7TC77_PLEWA|nr:hypothetical protein NDU88_005983 [Pleurodeles waltl]